MKLLSGSLAFVALASGSAVAADLPTKAPPRPGCIWCGAYIGINGGWVGAAGDTITNSGTDTGTAGLGSALAAGALPTPVSLGYNGFMAGGQVGYNWQIASWVFGGEADLDGVFAKASTTSTFPGNAAFAADTSTYSREFDWFSSLRARGGVTVWPTFLVYATGGVAFGYTKIGSSENCPAAAPPCASEPSMTNATTTGSLGFAAGAGAEWMFAPHWSFKAEYLFADFGQHSTILTYTYPVANSSNMTSTAHDSVNIVRAGINWHF
jgi:outer membrane immunogenic protein